jgi:adenylate cyclase
VSRLHKGLLLGLLTGIAGLAISLFPFGMRFEENTGLNFLFKSRGKREAPSDVVIVTMDEKSSGVFGFNDDPSKWPRSIHAKLTDTLVKKGAAVIVFDVIFEEPQPDAHDVMFARAIRDARNVILTASLEMKIVPIESAGSAHADGVNIERMVEPVFVLKDAAAAQAPFPLPKVPARVSQYWTFKKGAQDIATLPVVAFQLYAFEVYSDFFQNVKATNRSLAEQLSEGRDAVVSSKNVEKLILNFRNIHTEKPYVINKALDKLNEMDASDSNQWKRRRLRSLLRMYQSPSSRYLNFYGPPGNISTVSYCEVVQRPEDQKTPLSQIDFKGKAVFVGYSERLRPDQKDGFLTVFSQPTGVDISGVEIAATAFSNILEDMHVEPVGSYRRYAIFIACGLFLGIFCRFLPTIVSGIAIIGVGALYVVFAQFYFNNSAIWYPITIPLLVQAPVAFFGTVLWKYADTHKERKHIRRAFGYYLPNTVVDQLAKNVGDIRTGEENVHGTCLFTDAGKYTTLSETMKPAELSHFMNNYYGVLFEPVKKHGGIVINVVGDSMLAVWATGKPDRSFRQKACLAALDIEQKASTLNDSLKGLELPIRIGLHSGDMLLGSIGAMDHYEYRPIGDIVNTASRMEGLNKYLRTRLLVSKEVLQDLDGFFARGLGEFRFVGKSNPTAVYELVCRVEDATDSEKQLDNRFMNALEHYRLQSFPAAIDAWKACLDIRPQYGPALYYLERCKKYLDSPPQGVWDGIVHLNEK